MTRKKIINRLKRKMRIPTWLMILMFLMSWASTITIFLAGAQIRNMQDRIDKQQKIIRQEYNILHTQYPNLTYKKYCIIKDSCKKYEAEIFRRSHCQIKPDVKLVCSVIKEESDFLSTAVSKSGAVGDMQLMPCTAKYLHVTDRTDPKQNIDGGIRHLYFTCLPKSGNDMQRAIELYNCGQNKKYEDIPDESKRYASRCMRNYERSTGYMLAML